MAMGQRRRVSVEPEVLEQLRTSATAGGAISTPEDGLPAKVVGPPVVVLAYEVAQRLDVEARDTLPPGLVAIEVAKGSEVSMGDLDVLASKLDRDLLVRRPR